MRYLILATVLLLTACETKKDDSAASAEKENLLRASMKTSFEDCDRRFKSGELTTRVARAHCINNAHDRIMRQHSYAYMDLEHLYAAKRLELAERQDAGTITEAQAKLEWTQLNTQIISEVQRRNTMRAQRRAAENSGPRASQEITCEVVREQLECTTW